MTGLLNWDNFSNSNHEKVLAQFLSFCAFTLMKNTRSKNSWRPLNKKLMEKSYFYFQCRTSCRLRLFFLFFSSKSDVGRVNWIPPQVRQVSFTFWFPQNPDISICKVFRPEQESGCRSRNLARGVDNEFKVPPLTYQMSPTRLLLKKGILENKGACQRPGGYASLS